MKRKLELPYLPIFDARCVAYPEYKNIRDYLSWR
jgi:tRNA(His) 5'-end guanylyltransferase